MAVLLTGGTGKTSLRIARLLQDAKVPFLLASRRGKAAAPDGMPAVTFDWLDRSTFENPFSYAFPSQKKISAVYLIAPEGADPVPPMNAFIDLAASKHGVKRFVFLTGSSVEKDGYYVGKVWQHLDDVGAEYCVLRATWFMERFSEQEHLPTIKHQSKIYTACGGGKAPFVSAHDIAAIAFRTLIDENPPNTDYRVLGPELLSHDDVAAKLSLTLGRHIEHVKLSPEERIQYYIKAGFPEHLAQILTSLETATANGAEEMINDAVETVTGKAPMKMDDWIQMNKEVWQ